MTRALFRRLALAGLLLLAMVSRAHALDAACPPARLPPCVPPVVVEGVYVDGSPRDPSAPLLLQRRPRTVRFLYAATRPSGGEPPRFRYRLEGLDTDWTDAGTRRAITYNSLVPGHYRFRVQSSADGGAWLANERTFDFTVEPRWHETLTFRLSCAVAGALGLWAVHRWNLRRLTRRVRLQMRVQQIERERIAGDLHDSLLQGIQALVWRIHGIAAGVLERSPLREKLDDVIERAEGLLADSCRRVTALRRRQRIRPAGRRRD